MEDDRRAVSSDGHVIEENDSPIEEVRLTVPVTDDPTLPVMTFRTWVMGLISCFMLAFLNQFFSYRQNFLYVSTLAIQIASLPLGKFMGMTLPSKPIKVPLTSWSFSLNPGPFNMKEHVLITLFAMSGANFALAVHIITSMKAYYHRPLNPIAAFLLIQTTQLLGFGWAGLLKKHVVDNAYMWWPYILSQVPFFRALHEKEMRPRKGLTRLQFFLIASVCSFAYYIVPGYLFPSISVISLGCLIWKDSITLQQIGSGLHGFGIGSFTLDWNTISVGGPLTSPASTSFNSLIGFILVMYVALPLLYYNNVHEARRFPLISSDTFDSEGQPYNISQVIDPKRFALNQTAYEEYGKLYISPFYAFNGIGLSFAAFAATLTHVALFYGKDIWKTWRTSQLGDKQADVHTRLMKRNYDEVPQSWFYLLLVSMFALSIYTVQGFGNQLQLPWWGLLIGLGITFIFTLPGVIIVATTGAGADMASIMKLVIGYMYPGRPLAYNAFIIYGHNTMLQTQTILGFLKLGHYMKIPPKAIFIAQLVGTVVASTVSFFVAWWLLTTIEHICEPSKLPLGSPWTCPVDELYFNNSIIWGVVGPLSLFSKHGNYPEINWFFLIGFLAPVPGWVLAKKYPEKKWLACINMPVIFSAASSIPPLRSINYTSAIAVGLFFNYYIYNRYKEWWSRHTYILSSGLDAGLTLAAMLLYLFLQRMEIYGPQWWGLDVDDHCPLASCPTAPGIRVEGCPVL